MSAYAIAHLRTPQINDDVLSYLERIQQTLDPYGGRFLVHGGEVEVREGTWPGTVVVLEFAAVEDVRGWYDSPAYQAILPLRTDHIETDAILVAGVPDGYDAGQRAADTRARHAL